MWYCMHVDGDKEPRKENERRKRHADRCLCCRCCCSCDCRIHHHPLIHKQKSCERRNYHARYCCCSGCCRCCCCCCVHHHPVIYELHSVPQSTEKTPEGVFFLLQAMSCVFWIVNAQNGYCACLGRIPSFAKNSLNRITIRMKILGGLTCTVSVCDVARTVPSPAISSA